MTGLLNGLPIAPSASYIFTNRNFLCILIFATLISLLCNNDLLAADRYWLGGTSTSWNNTANWSTTSGGAGGASVPSTSDVAIFDGNSGDDCVIDATVDVAGMDLQSGFGYELSQGSYTITIGSSGFTMTAGTFTGGSSDVTINGAVNITGGSYTPTSAVTEITGDLSVSGTSGGSGHNNGTLRLGSTQTIDGDINVFRLELIGNDNTITITDTSDVCVEDTLYFDGTDTLLVNTGTICVSGHIKLNYSYADASGSYELLINGTGDQTIIGNSSSFLAGLGVTTIDKSSGTLTLKDYISVSGEWLYKQGGMDASTNFSEVIIIDNETTLGYPSASGTMKFHDLDFFLFGGSQTRELTTDLEIENNLTLTDTKIDLAGYKLTFNEGSTSALTPSTGALITDESTGASELVWNIAQNTGTYTLPLENSSADDLSLTYDVTSAGTGTSGMVSFNTYPTNGSNSPLPPSVTNVDDASGSDNSAYVVNRFWIVDPQNYTTDPTADITFTYANGDLTGTSITEGNLQAQFWNGSTWSDPVGTVNTTANTVSVSGVSYYGTGVWALVDNSSPLNNGFDVQWEDEVGASYVINKVTHTGTSGWGNAGAASINYLPGSQDGWLEFDYDDGSGDFMIGFSQVNLDESYKSINHAFQQDGSTLRIYEEGKLKGSYGTMTSGDVLRIERRGGLLYYYKNATVLRTSIVDEDDMYVIDAALYNNGDYFDNVTCSFNTELRVDAVIVGEYPGQGNGSITLDVKGGSGPYAYYWSTTATSSSITSLDAGTYTVTVSDNASTSIVKSYEVGYQVVWQNEVDVTTTANSISKSTASGSYDAGASSVNYLPPNTDGYLEFMITNKVDNWQEFIGLSVYDPDATPQTIRYGWYFDGSNSGSSLLLPKISTANPTGASNMVGYIGSVARVAREGSIIRWYFNGALAAERSTDPNLPLIIDVSQGTNYCKFEYIKTNIGIPYGLEADVTHITWPAAGTGSIELTVKGGTSPYTYSWSNGATTEDLSELAQGTYTVTVTDDNLTTVSASFEVGYQIDWQNEQDVSTTGTSIEKTTSSTALDAGASSINVLPAYTDGYFEFTLITPFDENGYIGLTETDASYNYDDIDFAVRQRDYNFELRFYQAGTLQSGTFYNSSGDRIRIGREGSDVKVYQNGTLVHTFTADASKEYIIDVSLGKGTPVFSDIYSTFSAPLNNVTWTNVVGASVASTTLTKTAADGYGNAGASTTNWLEANTNGFVYFAYDDMSSGKEMYIGLSEQDPDQENSTIEYGINITSSSAITIYENGVSKGSFGTATTGDDFYIERIGSNILYRHNGDVIRTVASDRTKRLIVDVSIYGQNEEISDVVTSFDGPMRVDGTITHVDPTSANSGSIDLSEANGTNPYTYLWSTGATSQDISSLSAGTYTVTVTDNVATTVVESFEVGYQVDWDASTKGAVTTSGHSVINDFTSGEDTYDGVASNNYLQPGEDGYVSIKMTQDYSFMKLGLSEMDIDGETGTTEYGFYTGNSNTISIIEGSNTVATLAPYELGDIYKIARVSDSICYYLDDSLIVCSPTDSTERLVIDVSVRHDGAIYQINTDFGTPLGTFPILTHQDAADPLSGSIDLNVKGGTEPYTFLWDDGDNVEFKDELSEGIYSVTVTDANSTTVASSVALGYIIKWTDVETQVAVDNHEIAADGFATGYKGAFSKNFLKAYTDGYVEFRVRYSNSSSGVFAAIGLSEDNPDGNYTTIDYGFLKGAGNSSIYESGTQQLANQPFRVGDVLKVAREGSYIKYYQNDTELRSVAVDPSKILFIDASVRQDGAMYDIHTDIGGVLDSMCLYWTGADDSLWCNPLNWSYTSGGPSADTIPDSTFCVWFDGESETDTIVLNCDTTVASLTLLDDFTGVIVQGANDFRAIDFLSIYGGSFNASNSTNTLTIDGDLGIYGGTFNANTVDLFVNTDLVMTLGAFDGGTSSIDITGTTSVTGGTFTNSSGTTYVRGDFTITDPSYSHNNGTIEVNASINMSSVAPIYTLKFVNSTSSPITITMDSDIGITVANELRLEGVDPININSGTIVAEGDVTITNTSASGGGTGTLALGGLSDLTLDNTNTTAGNGRLPNLEIRKGAGTATLKGKISVDGDFSYRYGKVDASTNTSEVIFYGDHSINGEGSAEVVKLYDVTFGDSDDKTLEGSFGLTNSLSMGDADLFLNSNTLIIDNTSNSVISTNTGNIIGETTDMKSRIEWKINNTTSTTYNYPLSNSNGDDLTISVTLTATGTYSDAGYISVSTYPASSTMTPLAPGIPELFEAGETTTFDKMANRYWHVQTRGYSANPTFGMDVQYLDADISNLTSSESDLRCQMYDTYGWDDPIGTLDAANNKSSFSGIIKSGVIGLIDRYNPLFSYRDQQYYTLKRKLDGGYYVAIDKLGFKYDGEYNYGNFEFKIYDIARNVIIDNTTVNTTSLKQYGDNRFSIGLHCFSGMVDGDFYTLEVTNEKNEVFKLRFQYINRKPCFNFIGHFGALPDP